MKVAKLLAGAAVVVAVVVHLGTGAVLEGVRAVSPTALLAALGLGVLTTAASAARWCVVARGLGLEIGFGPAVARLLPRAVPQLGAPRRGARRRAPRGRVRTPARRPGRRRAGGGARAGGRPGGRRRGLGGGAARGAEPGAGSARGARPGRPGGRGRRGGGGCSGWRGSRGSGARWRASPSGSGPGCSTSGPDPPSSACRWWRWPGTWRCSAWPRRRWACAPPRPSSRRCCCSRCCRWGCRSRWAGGGRGRRRRRRRSGSPGWGRTPVSRPPSPSGSSPWSRRCPASGCSCWAG